MKKERLAALFFLAIGGGSDRPAPAEFIVVRQNQ
jgi:hypothetical protein